MFMSSSLITNIVFSCKAPPIRIVVHHTGEDQRTLFGVLTGTAAGTRALSSVAEDKSELHLWADKRGYHHEGFRGGAKKDTDSVDEA